MLVLSATTDTITAQLGASPVTELPMVVCYRDINTVDYTAGRQGIRTNGTTPVALVPSPASGVQRVIDTINIYNPNAANVTITITLDLNSVLFPLYVYTLATGERLEYQDGNGCTVYSTSGAQKNSLNQGTNSVSTGNSRMVLSSDVINNNATANTIQDVTGLSFPVVANQRYSFRFVIPYSAAVSTTGSRWCINGPSFNELAVQSMYSLTGTSNTINYVSAYDLPAASNATSAITGTGNYATIEGIIRPTADGSVIARFASEVSGSAITAKAGAYVDYQTI